MIRRAFYLIAYLIFAELVEAAITPQLKFVVPQQWEFVFDFYLLALAGILAGCLWGHWLGMGIAVLAAALNGFSQDPGLLGASIVGYTPAAYLAGSWGPKLRGASTSFQWFGLFILLCVAVWCQMLVRQLFWEITPFNIFPAVTTLLMVAITAGFGVVLIRWAPMTPRRKTRFKTKPS